MIEHRFGLLLITTEEQFSKEFLLKSINWIEWLLDKVKDLLSGWYCSLTVIFLASCKSLRLFEVPSSVQQPRGVFEISLVILGIYIWNWLYK